MVYKFTCEYIGTNYCGFQRQKNGRTVQEELETALSRYFGHEIKLVGSGRTDAGVHAKGQVCSCGVEGEKSAVNLFKLCAAVNSFLPTDISVREFEVDPKVIGAKSFNARAHAKSKIYVYKCYISEFRSSLREQFFHRIYKQPNIETMRIAAAALVGTHDFTSFASADTDKINKVRTISSLDITQSADEITFRVRGDAFLKNMVRIIVGTLLEVGNGKLKTTDIAKILAGRNRNLAGSTAPARGLCLESVEY